MILRTAYNVIRALVTAPDVVHWIKKYDAAKKRVEELERRVMELEKANEEVLVYINDTINDLLGEDKP